MTDLNLPHAHTGECSVASIKQIQATQHPHRAFAVFAGVVNGYLEVYETMRGSKRLTLRALMGREK